MSPDTDAMVQEAPRVFMEDMGCQMNRLDSEIVLGRLKEAGFQRVESPAEADVVLYYTCSVREHAEDKVYGRLGALKRLKNERPGMVIGIMGCMAQNHKEEIFKRAPHVDLVAGTSRFEDVVELLDEVRHGQRVLAVDHKELAFSRDVSVRPRRHQAFVTVMRGCNKFCSFCIVPFTQGRERSRPEADVVDEVKALVDDGVVEVTLLGQRIDTYGLDLDASSTLARLLERIHEEVPDLLRLGYITCHPNHMSGELARVVRDCPRISRYLHLPVQSGSDRVLRAMNRGYTVDEYRRALDLMRETVDDLSVATDWIVGFPGETEEDFQSSLALMREISYQNSFVFKYSPRRGTRAHAAGDPIPREEKARRNQVLLKAQEEISLERNRRRIGTDVEVIVEGTSKRDASKDTGRTWHNNIVCFEAGRVPPGHQARVRIRDCTPLTLFGDVVSGAEDPARNQR